MKGNTQTILKLQTALNAEGDMILQRTTQFYSKEQRSAVTVYHIERAVWNEEKQKYINTELFKSASQLQVILFLRDVLFINRGQPLPVDNDIWNEKRKKIEYYNTVENITYEEQ